MSLALLQAAYFIPSSNQNSSHIELLRKGLKNNTEFSLSREHMSRHGIETYGKYFALIVPPSAFGFCRDQALRVNFSRASRCPVAMKTILAAVFFGTIRYLLHVVSLQQSRSKQIKPNSTMASTYAFCNLTFMGKEEKSHE